MRITNTTNGAVLAEDAREARTLSEKLVGLIGTEAPHALFFRTRWGIHTFGMRFPIDCVVFDRHGVVRALRVELLPRRFFSWNPFWGQVLELPAGTLSRTGTERGHRLAVAP